MLLKFVIPASYVLDRLFIMSIFTMFFRVLTPYEAKSLVALLYSEDKTLIERALVTIANCAAFSVNLVSCILIFTL